MIEATTRMLAPALLSALLAAFAAGCSVSGNDDADKAGSSAAPVVLRLAVADDADQPDAPFARYFARRVSALSGRLDARANRLGCGRPGQPGL